MKRRQKNLRMRNFYHAVIRSFVHSGVQWENFRRTLLDDKGRHANPFPKHKKDKGTMTTLKPGSRQSTINDIPPLFNISWHHIKQSNWFLISYIYKGTFFKFGYEST
jgi:hypothetical protein